MGRRKTLFSSVAAGAVLFATLAACGNAASQPPASLPAAHAATSPSPSASTPSPTPDASASIPADLKINFEQPTTTDANLLAVSADAKSLVYAFEEALAKGSPADPLVHTLVTQQADVQITELLIQLTGKKTRPSGTLTFFRVTPTTESGFYSVGFCEDDSKATPVTVQGDARQGSAPTGSNALRQWEITFVKGNLAKPQINNFFTQVGGKACS
jgi:predicted small lipoprotein YifL